MRKALAFSFLTHLLVFVLLTVVGLQTGKHVLDATVYTVRLMEFPSVTPLKALDVTDQVRQTERQKPLPPVEVERIKTREKRVDEEKDQEVEIAKRTEPVVEKEEVTGVGGIRVEGKEFEFPYYFEIIRRRLQLNFRNPFTGRDEARLRTTVFFQITSTGSIVNTDVEQPSGFSAFDRAARRAVLASGPFPPLPEGYSGDILGVHCDFLSARE
jgi:TonB family protein